jgi:hypothetical protein
MLPAGAGAWGHKQNMDSEYMKKYRVWMRLEFALFVIFTPLVYIMTKGFLPVFGALPAVHGVLCDDTDVQDGGGDPNKTDQQGWSVLCSAVLKAGSIG